MTFAKRLSEELQASGMTQKELAERVGVTQGAVNYWLHGTEPPRPKYVKLLSALPGLVRDLLAELNRA